MVEVLLANVEECEDVVLHRELALVDNGGRSREWGKKLDWTLIEKLRSCFELTFHHFETIHSCFWNYTFLFWIVSMVGILDLKIFLVRCWVGDEWRKMKEEEGKRRIRIRWMEEKNLYFLVVFNCYYLIFNNGVKFTLTKDHFVFFFNIEDQIEKNKMYDQIGHLAFL